MNLEINGVEPVCGVCHITCADVCCGRFVDGDEGEQVR
jgi:hypothetical protein